MAIQHYFIQSHKQTLLGDWRSRYRLDKEDLSAKKLYVETKKG